MSLQERVEQLEITLKRIYKILFLDNGEISVQTKLAVLRNQVKFQWCVIGGVLMGLIAASIKKLW